MTYRTRLWKHQKPTQATKKPTQATKDDQSRPTTSPGSSQVVGHTDMPLAMHSSAGQRGPPEKRVRKHRTRSTTSPSSSSSLIAGAQQHPSPNLWSWRAHLPQSGDDRAVSDKARQVFALADQYVSNYYQNLRLQTMKHSEVFSNFKLPHLPQGLQVDQVLHKSNNPKAVIKHCLVHALVLMISFDARGPFSSLLPPEFTMLAKSLRMTTSSLDVADSQAAFSAYRVLSSYLRPDVLGGSEPYHSIREQVIAETFIVFSAFDPWLHADKSRNSQETSWANLMLRTSELGVFLYSQASTFFFSWPVENPTEGSVRIAISPHLLKVCDEEGQQLEPAQHMLNSKSEEAWNNVLLSSMDPYEVSKLNARDEEGEVYQQLRKVQSNEVRRKPVAAQPNTALELDGRDSVGRSPPKSSLIPSQARKHISELPAHPMQAVELDTQPGRSRSNSVHAIPIHITPHYWKQATDPPSDVVEAYQRQRQDRHSARDTPPTAYPTNGPNLTPCNGGSVHVRDGPEVPLRQSSTASTRRRSMSIGRNPTQSSDRTRPRSSQGSIKVLRNEDPLGPSPSRGHGGTSEVMRFGSLRGRPIAPDSHSQQFKDLLSKPHEPDIANRPLPSTPSEMLRLEAQQSISRGNGAENKQQGSAPGRGGGENPSKKVPIWSKIKQKAKEEGYFS